MSGITFHMLFKIIENIRTTCGSRVEITTKTIALHDGLREYYSMNIYSGSPDDPFTKDFDNVGDVYTFLDGYEACAIMNNQKRRS